MTKVEEWTKEDTGVGAAIAAGSQEEKGTWALLVERPKKIKSMATKEELDRKKSLKFQPPPKKNIKLKIKKQSPIRFIKTVSSPDLRELTSL